MATVYQLFAGHCDTETLLAVARDRREQFYSQLYAGLYAEALGDPAHTRRHISAAATMYLLDDYMGWLAVVHQRQRNWA